MLGIAPIETRAHQRLAESSTADSWIAADHGEIPVWLFGMGLFHEFGDFSARADPQPERPDEAGHHQQLLAPGLFPPPGRIPQSGRPDNRAVGGDLRPTSGQEVMPRHRREHVGQALRPSRGVGPHPHHDGVFVESPAERARQRPHVGLLRGSDVDVSPA